MSPELTKPAAFCPPARAVDSPEWVLESSLVRAWHAMKDEILRHKWYESEKAGRDIGWDRAFVNWMIHHSPTFSSKE